VVGCLDYIKNTLEPEAPALERLDSSGLGHELLSHVVSDRPATWEGEIPMTDPDNFRPEDFGHPRGTLAIVIIYGLLFGLAWLGLYFYVFLPRGVPQL
jgi:hypothetical protein